MEPDAGPGGAPDAALDAPAPDAFDPAVRFTQNWVTGGGGHPLGGGAARDNLKLYFGATNATGWFMWRGDGKLAAFGADPGIQAVTVKLIGGFSNLSYVNALGGGGGIGFFLSDLSTVAGVPRSAFVPELDSVRSISGVDNFVILVGSKNQRPHFSLDNRTAVPIADAATDRYFGEWLECIAGVIVLSPQDADAGNALVVRGDGTTIFAAATAGAASCQNNRLVMDGKLYSLSSSGEVRTELATLSTAEVSYVKWTHDGTVVLVTDQTARLFSSEGALLATESAIARGLRNRVVPEIVGGITPTPGVTYAVFDDTAMRFDPQISQIDQTGEVRITGHDDGNVSLAIGAAIVSGGRDTLIVQDPLTGRWLDDRDTAFDVSSVAIHGNMLATAQRLVASSVRIERITSTGKLALINVYDLDAATAGAQVAWSASGERLAIAYRTGPVARVEVHHPGATPELEWSFDVSVGADVASPVVAWDTADERLAVALGGDVALWTPGQIVPGPRVAATARKLAWGPGHVLAIGGVDGVDLYTVDLQLRAHVAVAGDFAWSPTGRLALVDAGGIRVWARDALSERNALAFETNISRAYLAPLPATRVGWVDDTHLVVVTGQGFVAQYQLEP